ncbi:MAG TPA: isoprenylcysteine carboxylmethyltransferase family protein [Ktedonobacteraceae bacterium]|jgi:protein-S-isoprenylcysteine O-methyltransferase Ste14
MQKNSRDTAGVIAPPPLIYLGSLIIGFAIQARLPLPLLLPKTLRRFLGSLLLGGSVVLTAGALRTFQKAGASVNPAMPTSELVCEGPYQVIRHPLYLSLTMFYTAIALFGDAFWVMALLPIIIRIMNRGVIEREEGYLERKFGDRYRQYKERVPRWF